MSFTAEAVSSLIVARNCLSAPGRLKNTRNGVCAFHHISRINRASSRDKCIAVDCAEWETVVIGQNLRRPGFHPVTYSGLYFSFFIRLSLDDSTVASCGK